MKHVFSRNGEPAGLAVLRIPLLVMLCMVLGSVPALALWLPWAGDEDKVKKTIADVWSAVIQNDVLTLKQNLTGAGADAFINQQRELVLREKISNFTCQVRKITMDAQTRNIAFAEVERVATLETGGERTFNEVSVLQKVGGNWRLVTGIKKKARAPQDLRRLKQEAAKRAHHGGSAQPEEKPSLDETSEDEIPPAEVNF